MLTPTTDRMTEGNWKGYFNNDILIVVLSISDQESRYLEIERNNNGASLAHISWCNIQRKTQGQDNFCGIGLQNTLSGFCCTVLMHPSMGKAKTRWFWVSL